jgi:hypothetical protein
LSRPAPPPPQLAGGAHGRHSAAAPADDGAPTAGGPRAAGAAPCGQSRVSGLQLAEHLEGDTGGELRQHSMHCKLVAPLGPAVPHAAPHAVPHAVPHAAPAAAASGPRPPAAGSRCASRCARCRSARPTPPCSWVPLRLTLCPLPQRPAHAPLQLGPAAPHAVPAAAEPGPRPPAAGPRCASRCASRCARCRSAWPTPSWVWPPGWSRSSRR